MSVQVKLIVRFSDSYWDWLRTYPPLSRLVGVVWLHPLRCLFLWVAALLIIGGVISFFLKLSLSRKLRNNLLCTHTVTQLVSYHRDISNPELNTPRIFPGWFVFLLWELAHKILSVLRAFSIRSQRRRSTAEVDWSLWGKLERLSLLILFYSKV